MLPVVVVGFGLHRRRRRCGENAETRGGVGDVFLCVGDGVVFFGIVDCDLVIKLVQDFAVGFLGKCCSQECRLREWVVVRFSRLGLRFG